MVTTQSYHRRNLGGLNKIVAYIFTVIRMGLSKHAGIGRQFLASVLQNQSVLLKDSDFFSLFSFYPTIFGVMFNDIPPNIQKFYDFRTTIPFFGRS